MRAIVQSSIFEKCIKAFEVSAVGLQADKENKGIKLGKISSEHSAVISGLKCFLSETTKLVSNLSEDYFNLDAKPFMPKKAAPGLNLKSISKSDNNKEPLDPVTEQLEKKRQISQMYQYYNYLIFEKNKESFNDINPDLRKMTYKFDQESKHAFMTVTASPEVIKAAMGMNVG